MSRHRFLTIAGLCSLAIVGGSLALGAAPANASPADAWSSSPSQLFVGDSTEAQIEFDVPDDGSSDELPTAVSFAAASDADPSRSAVTFDIVATTPNLSGCALSGDLSSGSCQWTDAVPGDTAIVTVKETGVADSLGLQHLTFSQTLSDDTTALAGSQDMTVLAKPVTATATVSSPTVAVGGHVTVTATFVITPGTPSDYLPTAVGFYALQDVGAGLGALRFTLDSYTGASSCQVNPDGRGLGCQLDDPVAGSTITIVGTATATTDPMGDNPAPSPLGAQYLYLTYSGPNLFGPGEKSDQVVNVVAASGTGTGTGTGSSDPAGTVAASSQSGGQSATTLADTGSDVLPAVGGAALLVLLGGAGLALTSSRRRRTTV